MHRSNDRSNNSNIASRCVACSLAAALVYAPLHGYGPLVIGSHAYAADPFTNASNPQSKEAEEAPIELITPPSKLANPVNASNVSVSDFGTVVIQVQDAPLGDVLKMLSQQSQKNIVASKDVGGLVTASLYDVTIKEALDAILHANGFAYREKGNFIYVYTAKELEEIELRERKPRTEVFRVFYTPAANAVNMIKPVLSEEAQVSFTTPALTGIESGIKDIGGNSHATEDTIVVTDFPENLERVKLVLKEVDRRPQQVLVEATILRATLSEDNALGVDFNILAGVNFSNIINNGSQITNGTTSGSNIPLGGTDASIGTGNNFSSQINNGFRFGLVTDNASVFVAALEGVTDTTVLANPKVLTLNKQKGEVIVGRKDGYLTTTVTESSTVQTVEFLDTGTRLIFRPYIGDDGYVRMEIHPEDSSGGLTANANLPFKITTEVTSNIMVKDGNTIVIGGLFRESSDSARSQVPLLGSIPLAGQLFRNQRDRTTREEIIILLTPHIIKDESAYAAESEAAIKDAEKLRVGVRKGMMPWGRERMAESAFEKAMEELGKPTPNKSKAMWHLNIATNLNPKFAEAIKLKEQITGEQLESVDNSSVKGFVKRRVMAERELKTDKAPASVPIVTEAEKITASKTKENKAAEAKESASTVAEGNGAVQTTAPVETAEVVRAESTEKTGFTVSESDEKPSTKNEEVALVPPVDVSLSGDVTSDFTGNQWASFLGHFWPLGTEPAVVTQPYEPADTATVSIDEFAAPLPPRKRDVAPLQNPEQTTELPAEGEATTKTTEGVTPASKPTTLSAPASQPISVRTQSGSQWGALKAAKEARKANSPSAVTTPAAGSSDAAEPKSAAPSTQPATAPSASGDKETAETLPTVTELPDDESAQP